MRRSFTDPDADPLALDEDTVERLLTGDLPPAQAPPRYAEVAALLAAMVDDPTPDELAGRSAALAELRAVTRVRRAAVGTRRAARPPRRRRVGLAAVALVGALATGGAAAAATGRLPDPVREAALSILDTVDGAGPATPAQPGLRPAPVPPTGGAGDAATGRQGPRPTGSTHPGAGPLGTGPVGEQDTEGLCRAFLASQDNKSGKKMDATAFELLARAAGGESRIPSYCETRLPGGPGPEDHEPPGPPDEPGQGQGGSAPGTGGQQVQGAPPSPPSSSR